MSTQGIIKKEPDPCVVYADIIDHPHWQSPTRKHMSLYDRAAQFSAFDALAGYSDMVVEEARLTDTQVELSEGELDVLNQKISAVADAIAQGDHPTIAVTFFVPDTFKAGGSYEKYTGSVKKVDAVYGKIVFYADNGILDGKIVLINSIQDISGEYIETISDRE